MKRRFDSPLEVAKEFQARGLPARFCHVPFTTLILEPDGTVGSCRMKGTLFTVGDLRHQTPDEIWNGPKLREWRRQFLQGDPVFCQKEVRCNACHLCPDYNSLLPVTEAREELSSGPLRLGLNLNGRCNLECQMCHIWKEPNGLYDEWGLWPKVLEMASKAKEIELFSGEPFIQKDTYRLIEALSQSNPDCLWTITSNGHWILTDKIKEALDKIDVKHLTISMDSLNPETYAKIRRKGRLQMVLDNLKRLQEYDHSRLERGLPSLSLRISFAVQKDNWKELGDFHEFGKKMNLPIFRAFVYEPKSCSLLTLSPSEKEELLDFCRNTLTKEQWLHSRRAIVPVMDSLPAVDRARHLLEFRELL
jgi:cyclic pyranopterin phosphate synthase